MSANVIYLSRSGTRQFYKYSACTAVVMTGQVAAYSGVTGVAATDIVTIPGLTAVDGMSLSFTNLAGGAGLTTGRKYYLVNSSGSTAKLATSQGGTAINFTTDITATTTVVTQTDDLLVWSSEYRDVFAPASTLYYPGAGVTSGSVPTATDIIFDGPLTITPPSGGVTPTGIGVAPIGDPYGSNSDDIAHAPLRNTQLPRSYWKFTMSTAPTTLWAEVLEGDVLSDSPPNTP